MRASLLTLFGLCALLLMTACAGPTSAQPYTRMQTVETICSKLAAEYGEPHPTITKVSAMLSDGATALPMNQVTMTGRFQKGDLVATQVSFSMLADGSMVWAVYATDDQYATTHTPVWEDHASDIKL